jgi:hypothetical protein
MTDLVKRTRVPVRTLKAAIANLPKKLASKSPNEINTAFGNHFAYAFFKRVEKNFESKSEGGRDEFGVKWKPLSPKSIAARPLTKDEIKRNRIAEMQQRGLLTPAQNRIWRGIFASLMKKYILQMSMDKAKIRAAKVTWVIMKNKGALTKLQVYGSRRVKILRVSDRLFKSVKAGTLTGNRYYKPKEQIAKIEGNEFTFGSMVPYANRQAAMRPIFPTQRNMSTVATECVQDAMRGVISAFIASLNTNNSAKPKPFRQTNASFFSYLFRYLGFGR